MNLADKISSSFQKDMKKEGMASWGMATRIIPQDSDLAPLFFWDAYENMEQVIDHLMYKAAIKNAYSSFIYNKDFAEILPHILDEKGIINIGTKKRSIFNFAKQNKKNIKGIKINKNSNFPIDSSLNISKFKKIIKKNVKKSYSF